VSLRANHKIICVHRCFNQQLEVIPAGCKCGQYITVREADNMVACDQARWVMRPNTRGYPVRDTRAIVILRRKPKCEVSRAETLERKHMEAMAGMHGGKAQEYHVERAEIYNVLTEQAKAKLGAVTRPRETMGSPTA